MNQDRIKPLLKFALGKSPESKMRDLLGKLTPSGNIPSVDKYYVFIYKAKTPGVRYDQHPFIICTSIDKWGFRGYNYHWNDYRQYTWREVFSNVYEIYDNELESMSKLQTQRFKTA